MIETWLIYGKPKLFLLILIQKNNTNFNQTKFQIMPTFNNANLYIIILAFK